MYAPPAGGRVDVMVCHGDKFCFYDIETAPSARACIREALAQLLEYSFWPGGRKAKRLVVVGEPFLDGDSQVFLARLKKQFSLPISYQQFDMSKGKFEGTEQSVGQPHAFCDRSSLLDVSWRGLKLCDLGKHSAESGEHA
jgi:hypothetical protein